MPRLPTMRVMGSQAISTRPLPSLVNFLVAIALPPCFLVAGHKFPAWHPPLGLVFQGVRGYATQAPDGAAVEPAGHGGHACPRWLIHEGHEFVGEAGHGA